MRNIIENSDGTLNMTLAKRTKYMVSIIADACVEQGANKEIAESCAVEYSKLCFKNVEDTNEKIKKKAKEKDNDTVLEKLYVTDTLMFISEHEANEIAKAFKEKNFDSTAKVVKEILKLSKEFFKPEVDGLDIALFGRMVASETTLNVEAACSVSHAISTHKVSNEIDFFTAVDDSPTEQGSAHMGSLEFNSATYYRYFSLDLGTLFKTLNGNALTEAIDLFTKAIYLAVPSARQTTQASYCAWEHAKVMVRKGQNMQLAFDKDVRYSGDGYLEPSIQALEKSIEKHKNQAGSLYGLKGEFTLTEDKSIDDLCDFLKTTVDSLHE